MAVQLRVGDEFLDVNAKVCACHQNVFVMQDIGNAIQKFVHVIPVRTLEYNSVLVKNAKCYGNPFLYLTKLYFREEAASDCIANSWLGRSRKGNVPKI